MYEEGQGPIDNLVHLYVDGAFNRRELIRRVAAYTGSVAAALTALGGYSEAIAQEPQGCPAGIRVPADAPDLIAEDVQFPSEFGAMFGHLAYPRAAEPKSLPGVIVIHENRGLVDHHKDVTRRMARAGFVAFGVDLLSRQGGTSRFPEPTQQTAAYGRTTVEERRADLISSFDFLKSYVAEPARIGAVGFCAGGGNVWELMVNAQQFAAGVAYYGNPVPTNEQLEAINAPVLGIYAELDRNLTLRTPAIISGMLNLQKTFGFHIYQGARHAFLNDTGGAYDAAAACDAWARTIAWFNKFLRPPATA